MTSPKLFTALAGIGFALFLVVVSSLFGSSVIVRYLVDVDSKKLAYEWVESLRGEFDLPGVPIDPYHGPLEYSAALFMNTLDDHASPIRISEPSVFERNLHSGEITGYAIYNRFGMRLVGGGVRVFHNVSGSDTKPLFDEVVAHGRLGVFKAVIVNGRDRPLNVIMVPLMRQGQVNGVAHIEVTSFGNTLFLQRGVQIVSVLTAFTIAVLGLGGILLIYNWGRMARQATRKADFLASTDPITLLPNRRRFEEVLPQEIERARLNKSEFVVIFSDVDNFKAINDIYGHTSGDRFLVEIGERLSQLLPNAGSLFRISGDHFAVVLETPGGTPQIKAFCEKIQTAMRPVLLPDTFGVKVSLSCGVARFPQDGHDKEQLMKAADLALYTAKRGGRSTYRLFHAQMNSDSVDTVRLQHALERALQHDELHLAYQPQIKAGSGRLVGFEALARWTHPVEGPISPARFIPVAEKSGLIEPLGEWALRTACKEACLWPENMSIAVNLSPLQLQNPKLIDLVGSILNTTGITPHRLELEVTESVMMQDADLSQEAFEALRRLGVGLALDDFGTGFSSLSYLTRIPLTKIKIDKSFVDRYGNSDRDDAIITGLIQLSRSLGLRITAEGVETQAQAVGLSNAGCTSLQGYYFGRPTEDPRAVIEKAKHAQPTDMRRSA